MFGGLVGNQGGIRAAALLGFRLSARAFVATATASALFVDAARVPIYVLTARPVLASTVALWVAASIGVTIGTFIGVPPADRCAAGLPGARSARRCCLIGGGALSAGAARRPRASHRISFPHGPDDPP
jgi:uncharacterized membrane protein YfcA